MGKMLVAVLVGQTIADLPATLTGVMSAVTFFMTAAFIWFRKDDRKRPEREAGRSSAQSTMIAFAAIFFSEWGDIGQVTAAALTVQYKMPLVIWLSATLALMTKGLLSITLGVGLTRYVSKKVIRLGSVALCLVLGLFSIANLLV
jgi:putative Ca2+/H+ antiporter (TMEM165/GDT1 family)